MCGQPVAFRYRGIRPRRPSAKEKRNDGKCGGVRGGYAGMFNRNANWDAVSR